MIVDLNGEGILSSPSPASPGREKEGCDEFLPVFPEFGRSRNAADLPSFSL